MNAESNASYRNDTNTILIPSYGALVAKKFSNFDQKNAVVDLEFTLVLRLIVDKLDEELIDKLQKELKYRLNESEKEAPNGNIDTSADNKQFLFYTIRGNSSISTKESMRYSPFEVLSFLLKIELSHLTYKDKDVRFVFHKHLDPTVNLSFKDDCDCLAEFNVCKPQCSVSIKEEIKDEQIRYFPTIEFTFRLYREPGNKILTIFLPQFILGSIIFITNENCLDFDNKISIMATLLLAYIAFIPTIRSEMPSLPYVTLSDYVVYNYMICCIIPLFSQQANTDMVYRVIIGVLSAFPILIIVCMSFKHMFQKKIYDKPSVQIKKSSRKFNSEDWANPFCNCHML